MIPVKDLFGKTHLITQCTMVDINKHFEQIKNTIEPKDTINFKQQMYKSLIADSAFKLDDESCYLYYINDTARCATGVALYGKNSPTKMLALFAGIFTHIDTHTLKLNFHLHANKSVNEYKSIVTEASIRRQLIPGYPLVIRIDKLRDKINNIYNKRGMSCLV